MAQQPEDLQTDWFARLVSEPWWAIRDVLRVFWACRAPMVSVMVGGALIAYTDQARDIVMASAVAKDGVANKVGLVFTMLAWATMSWYWSRVTLSFSFALPPIDFPTRSPRPFRKWWVACVIWLAMVILAFIALMNSDGFMPWLISCAIVVIVSCWFFDEKSCRPERWRQWWRREVPRMIGALAIVAVGVAFWNASNAYADASDSKNSAIFFRWAVSFLVLAAVFYAGYVLVPSPTLVAKVTKSIKARLPAGRKKYLTGEERTPGMPAASTSVPSSTAPAQTKIEKFKTTIKKVKTSTMPPPDKSYEHLRDSDYYNNRLPFWILFFSLLASPLFFFWFVADPVGASVFMGGAVRAVLLGLAIMVPVLSLLALLSARLRLPLLGANLLWLVVASVLFGDHHDVRTLDKVHVRQPIDRVFRDWWMANAEPKEGFRLTEPVAPGVPAVPPMIVVATAGGASRAAYWTSQVLGEIAIREPHFTDRLFLISGVSGGSLGAVTFRSQITAHRQEAHVGKVMNPDTPKRSYGVLTRDFLTPAMATGLYVDLPLHAFPWWRFGDRASALEKAWETAWRAAMQDNKYATLSWEDGFAATFAGNAKDHAWPILMLNGSSVEKGKRIITSNVRLHTTGTSAQDPAGRLNRYDALDVLGKDIRISTAVTMSARFPVISPTGGMRHISYDANDKPVGGHVKMRVTDGGLYENFGAATADEMLRYVVERRSDTQPNPNHKGRTEKPVWPIVILISSDPSLDPLDKQTATGRRAVSDCAGVTGNRTPEPVKNPGSAWEECPVDARAIALTLIDPIWSLYSGRTARGEGAASALFQRVAENRVAIRDRVFHNIDVADEIADKDKESAKAKAWERLATNGLVEDFFHFRQCRVTQRKGPTMSWHDSPAAWGAMNIMLGLRPDPDTGVLDPCGNAGEFFRLCVRLTVVSGVYSSPPGNVALEEAATEECARRWPKPKDWGCHQPTGAKNVICGFWPSQPAGPQSAPIPRGSEDKPAVAPK